MATDKTIHYQKPPAAPGRGSQVDENLVIYFMWPKAGSKHVHGQSTGLENTVTWV